MAGEAQFTPETAKAVVGVIAHPEVALTGTTVAEKILETARGKHLAGQSEESLKVISGEVVPYSEKDVNRVLLWNSSSNRDPTTGEKKDPTNSNEITRLSQEKILVESARKFIETGHVDRALRDPLVNFLTRNSPAVADVITDMRAAGGDVDAFVDGLMKTPGFRENLRTLFIDRLNPTKRLSKEAAVNSLELEIAKLTAKLGVEVTQAEIDSAKTDLDTAKSNLIPKTAELLQIQVKTNRLQELTSQIKSIKEVFNKNKGVGSALELTKNDLLTARSGLNAATQQAQIDTIDAQIKKIDSTPAYANYISAQADITEFNALPGEIAGLQVALEPLQNEVTKKQEALNALVEKQKTNITPQKKAEIEADIKSKKSLLADAKTELEAEMIKFYQEVTHMGQDAMEKHLNGIFGKLKEMWKTEATKQAEEDTTKEGKLAALAIDKAYSRLCKTSETKGGLTFFKPDKNKAKNILNEAFKAGGGENIAVYLETQGHLALGLTVAEHTALKEKLRNPDFRKAQSEGIAKQALADYLVAGGRMNGDLVKSLATTDFGKSLLTEARTKADEAMQHYKDQFGKGVLDKSTRFGEFLKGNWWKFGIGILALLIILGVISATK